MIKNCNLLIPRPPYRTSKLQEKPSVLKREHPALQNIKFLTFYSIFWVIFALLDPNLDSESGSTDLIESGSETLKNTSLDPDIDGHNWRKGLQLVSQ
jgi:hypothetical protein